MTLRLGGDGAITGCTSLENPDLTVSGLTISGSFDAEKVLVASGTAAAPSYTFSGDTDNGLYYAGTNSIGLSTGGTNAILIDSSNRVGIGTTSPSEKFVVSNGGNEGFEVVPASASDLNVFYNYNRNTSAYIDSRNLALSHQFWTGSSSSEAMRIDSSGNVGIGTSSPSEVLDLRSTGTTRIFFESNDGGSPEYRATVGVDSAGFKIQTRDGTFGSNVDRLTIDSSGNVGIGTTSPSKKLQVDSADFDTALFKRTNSTGSATIFLSNTSNHGAALQSLGNGAGGFALFTQTSGTITERMRIDGSGNLGVGTSSPSGKLDIVTGTTGNVLIDAEAGSNFHAKIVNDSGDLHVGTRSTSADTFLVSNRRIYLRTGSSETTHLQISSDGSSNFFTGHTNVVISRSGQAASTSHSIYVGVRSATDTTNGTVVYRVYTNGTYATISDANQKKNIQTTRDGYLEDINKLRVVKYNWNEQDDTEPKELGLIAQEVEEVFPRLVTNISESSDQLESKGIKSSVLPYMLLKALQEATARIETLEAKVATLEASNTDLLARVTALEGA